MLNPSFPWLWQTSINILAIKSKRLHVIYGHASNAAQGGTISAPDESRTLSVMQSVMWNAPSSSLVVKTHTGALARAWWTDVVPWLCHFLRDYLVSVFLFFSFPSSQLFMTQADKILLENVKWLLEKKTGNWKECLIFTFHNCGCRDSNCCLF